MNGLSKGNTDLIAEAALAALQQRSKSGVAQRQALSTLHLRHVTGEASRLREQVQAALPAPRCYATACQSGYFLAPLRLAIIGLIE